MWNWLNTNSSAVQAFAAIVSAATTIFLAALTAWYVILTRHLAQATQAQLKSILDSQKEQNVRRKRELAALLKRFEEIQKQLPERDQDFNKLLSIVLWTERDIDNFQALMIQNGSGSAHFGREMVEPLRWLLLQHQNIQNNHQLLSKLDRQMFLHYSEKLRVDLLQMPLVFYNDSIDAYEEPLASKPVRRIHDSNPP
ncbi:MAG: hypothetical protein PHO08_03870 [Methylococcales bacterium]|nr:hypothetical protein [Methylococcales bacterium]MDD5632362.1 hypothetical protein [Methylococcales bacterium]